MTSEKIAFVGGGNMARSLIGGLIADGYDPSYISASDPNTEQLAHLAAQFRIRTSAENPAIVEDADIVVLAVKPQTLRTVANELRDTVQARQPLVISIAAGIREADLETWLGGNLALVRSMPNTPALIQAGATVMHANSLVSEEQKNLAESLLRAVGLTRWVGDESLMDAVTALSGSGPAYFFLVMEAIEKAGIELGLDPETAHLLTLQTALGSARMAMESSDPPATLRRKVTSPGGTTERALEALEKGKLSDLFRSAMADACDRSKELSKLLGDN